MKGLPILAQAALTVLLVAVAAHASGGGEEHALPWGNFAFRVANFVIFVAILWKFAGKKIVDFIKTRRYNIENDFADLEKRKALADARLKEVAQGIANLESERAKILADYQAQGQALKAAIVEKAEKSAAQIKAQAKMTADQEAKTAVERMRAELAELVAQAAQKVLEEKLTKEEHEKLIDKFLTKVVLN